MTVTMSDPTVPAAKPRRRYVSWLFGLVAFSALVGSIWYAYEHGLRRTTTGPPPLVKAEPGPSRVRPDEPGGLKVPYQGQTIYREIAPKAERAAPPPAAERLLPPPEQPLPKPKAPDPVAAPARPPDLPPATAAAPPSPAPLPPPSTVTAPQPAPAAPGPAPSPAAPAIASAPPVPAPAAPSAGAPIPLIPPPIPAPQASGAPAVPAPLPPPPAQAAAPSAPPVAAPVSTPPPPPQVAKVSPPPPAPSVVGIRVQLGAFGDQSQAERAWIKLQSAHGDVLGSTSPSVTEFTPEGKRPVYRLQAGPFADLGTARHACVELKARKVDCVVRP